MQLILKNNLAEYIKFDEKNLRNIQFRYRYLLNRFYVKELFYIMIF